MTKLEGFLWCPHCGSPHGLNALSCPKTGAPLDGSTNLLRGFRPETIVGERYKIHDKIGNESIAFLYEATQRGLGRRVLLKAVHAEGLPAEECDGELQEMEREAQASSLVDHPHVAPVLDYRRTGLHEGYLVRERSRMTLAARLRVSGSLPIEEAGHLLMQILSGVHALHEEGVVHRDLGSHNVRLVERAGMPPLAKIIGLGRSSTPKLGLPPDLPLGIHYASPELLRDEESVDFRSDIFSCGVILFEMLTGRRPFEAATPEDVATAILQDAPPSASKLRSALTASWIDVLEKALAKDPSRRFEDALAFQAAIPIAARPAGRTRFVEIITEDVPPAVALSSRPPSSEPPSAPVSSRSSSSLGSRCDRYIGRRIAKKYEIESLLGSGSAGAVYKATHIDLRRPVAVKVLHEWNRTSEQFVERFKSEALAASKLDHPNVTRILDCGEEPDGTLYLVMDFVEGRSLEAILAAEGRMPQERAVALAIQIVSSLVAAHQRQIIHRDVKPENIILVNVEGQEVVKVCDFGLAKLFDGTGSQELTRNGLMLGSPAYMAPEQIRGEPCDERTDIYAAGVTLFELLTGRLPHEATSLAEMFHRKLSELPTHPSAFVGDLDPLLEDIVIHALEAKPELRHASAAILRAELVEVLDEIRVPASSTHVVNVSVPPLP